MLSTFSRSVPSKIYEAWIFFTHFLVSCIMLHLTGWNLTPFPCPGTQLINIPLKFHCVFVILNFAIANAVISKKSYFRLSILCDIINVKREQQGTKNSALGTANKTGAQSDFTPFATTRSCLKHRNESIHFNVLPSIPYLNNLLLRSLWGGVSNAFFEIQYECVKLSSIVQEFSPIIYYRSQLSFTTMPFSECMLPIWQKIIFNKMSHDIWTYHVFE